MMQLVQPDHRIVQPTPRQTRDILRASPFFGLGLMATHATPGGAPWTPASIAAKTLYWLRADLGVTGTTWTDQTNGHVFAATTVTQDSSGLNGQKRLTFPGLAAGGSANVLTSTIGTVSATKGQAFAIGKSSTPGGSVTTGLWELGSSAGSFFQYVDGNIYDYALNSTRYTFANPLGLAAGTFAYEVKSDASGNWTARMNGSTIDTETGNTTAWPASVHTIGSGAVLLEGELEEILVLDDNMTSGEHASWVAYVLARYGIAA